MVRIVLILLLIGVFLVARSQTQRYKLVDVEKGFAWGACIGLLLSVSRVSSTTLLKVLTVAATAIGLSIGALSSYYELKVMQPLVGTALVVWLIACAMYLMMMNAPLAPLGFVVAYMAVLAIVSLCAFCVWYEKMFLTRAMRDDFYRLAERVHQACTDHHIAYFMVAGTALGIQRHQDMIPWDDDMDMGILEEDLDRFSQIDFARYGLRPSDFGLTKIGKLMLSEEDIPLEDTKKMQDIFMDVFVFHRATDDPHRIEYGCPVIRSMWPTEYFYEAELFPLRSYRFGSVSVNGPRDLVSYCRRAYGDSFQTPPLFRYTLYTLWRRWHPK